MILLLPQYLASLTIEELITTVILPVSGLSIITLDIFTGKISGRPWLKKKTTTPREKVTSDDVTQSSTNEGKILIGGFQVTESPETRVIPSDEKERDVCWRPTESILRASMTAGTPVIYRFERTNGNSILRRIALHRD